MNDVLGLSGFSGISGFTIFKILSPEIKLGSLKNLAKQAGNREYVMSASDQQLKEAKVVVVDDVKSARVIVKSLLTQVGCNNVVDFESADKALDYMKKNKVDLVISDWDMPGTQGLEFLEAIRSTPSLRKIPFIMVTSTSAKQSVLKALNQGVTYYLIKPMGAHDLHKALDVALSQNEKAEN